VERYEVDTMSSTTIGNVTINWLGHSGFMIKGEGKTIYIDPYVLPEKVNFEDMADIILITHEHYDHCNPDSIRKLRKEDTTTLIPEKCSLKFRGDARRIMEGDVLTGGLAIKDMDIEVVPAYNMNKQNHPKGIGVGYIIKVEGIRIYHAGDTDLIPEMKEITADVALLPIGGTYTMDESEAAEAAAAIAPKIVIPMHYNYLETTRADAEKFKKLVNDKNPDIGVVIL
jgi:L-ascorbate metabolism protein UlaG (beta-lactamase superfamily)